MTNIKDLTEYRLTKVEDRMSTYEQDIKQILLKLDKLDEKLTLNSKEFSEKLTLNSKEFSEKLTLNSKEFDEKIFNYNISWRNWIITALWAVILLALGSLLRPWFMSLIS
jgi:hypothetical protein